jgi:hypothetical protein
MISVRATEKQSVYFNHQVWTLAEGEQVDGQLAEYLLAHGGKVEEISTGPAVDQDGDGVPDGTVAQVLDWVSEDESLVADRAAAALEAENRRETPRTGVLTGLAKLAKLAPQD